MTTEEAIRIMEDDFTHRHPYVPERVSMAKQLGIEALKREQRHRKGMPIWEITLLPGETEE